MPVILRRLYKGYNETHNPQQKETDMNNKIALIKSKIVKYRVAIACIAITAPVIYVQAKNNGILTSLLEEKDLLSPFVELAVIAE
jgi:hypothetical protein